MSETLSSGLTLVIPSQGDINWASSIKALCFQKISEHDHTGGGKGTQITTAAIVADALTDAKIRLTSEGWLRSRNAGNSADINLIRSDSGDNTEISAGTGKDIQFLTGGTMRWQLGSTFLGPSTSNTYDLGGTSNKIATIYTTNIGDATHQVTNIYVTNILGGNNESVTLSSGEVDIACASGQQIKFFDGTNAKVEYTSNKFQPHAGETISLGGTGTPWTNIFGTGYLEMKNSSAPTTPTASGRLYVQSGALKYIGSNGTITTLAPS